MANMEADAQQQFCEILNPSRLFWNGPTMGFLSLSLQIRSQELS